MTLLAQALPHDPTSNLWSAGLFLDLDPLQGVGKLDRGEESQELCYRRFLIHPFF